MTNAEREMMELRSGTQAFQEDDTDSALQIPDQDDQVEEPEGNTEQIQDDNEEVEHQYEDVEAEARRRGWKDRDKWKGPDDNYEDAEAYVKRTDNDLRKERMRVKDQDERIKALEARDKERAEVVKKMMTMTERAQESLRRQYDEKIKEIERQKEEAVSDADIDRYKLLLEREKDLAQHAPAPKDDSRPGNDALGPWVEKNQWYVNDSEMHKYADFVGTELRKGNPYMSDENLLASVEMKVRENYPHKFQKKVRSNTQTVLSSDRRTVGESGAPKKRSFANLPPDCKAQAREWDEMGVMTIDEYVEGFDW